MHMLSHILLIYIRLESITMIKEEYQELHIEIEKFDTVDVIVTSDEGPVVP